MSKKSSIHPREILLPEFMKPLGLTASAEFGGQTSQSRLIVTDVSNWAIQREPGKMMHWRADCCMTEL